MSTRRLRWAEFLPVLLFLAACDRPQPLLTASGLAMGTTWSVQVAGPPPGLTHARLQRTVQQALDRVEARMSTFRPDSELSRINRMQTTDWIPVSRELLAVLETALEVAALTGGAFDPTVGPLVDLWGFGPQEPPRLPPDPEALRAARARVGHGKLRLRTEPPALRKGHPDLQLDLSAIAKGHGVDRAAEALERLGLSDYLVEVGGELRGRGRNARGEPWRIAIERPQSGMRAPYAVFSLRDLASATSGDYRNYREAAGRRYGHVIDPATGRPVAHGLVSVTVLDPSCLRADALATGLLVLGPERGMALAREHGIPAHFILRVDGALRHRASPAFAPYLTDREH